LVPRGIPPPTQWFICTFLRSPIISHSVTVLKTPSFNPPGTNPANPQKTPLFRWAGVFLFVGVFFFCNPLWGVPPRVLEFNTFHRQPICLARESVSLAKVGIFYKVPGALWGWGGSQGGILLVLFQFIPPIGGPGLVDMQAILFLVVPFKP